MKAITTIMLLSSAAFAAELPDPFAAHWDEQVGLWKGSTKHGKDGHDIRANAAELARAGCLGLLERVPAERVLANLRVAQATEGELRGNFWWSWEDKEVIDRNSGFFTTMGLLTLKHAFYEQLPDKGKADLDHMLAEAVHWFTHKVIPPKPEDIRYPNAFMGDAICLWLLRELDGSTEDAWRETFKAILIYYRDEAWGWGEHLSDLYVKVCQQELCALLLWAKDLDTETRTIAKGLLGELMGIDAAFAGGPRVPTIRCYWLDRSPRTQEEWPNIYKPYIDIANPDQPIDQFIIAHLAAKQNLFDDIPVPPVPDGPERTVPCHGGSEAVAWLDARWRLGVMTRYPLYEDTNDHPHYGLHWQSKPMAYWHAGGDWGYLQWLAEEGGKLRALPGMAHWSAPRERTCRLSDTDAQARFGWTRGMRHGPALLVHRELPKVSKDWTWMGDRFRLVNPTAETKADDEIDGWQRWTLTYDREVLTVACHPLQPGIALAHEDAGDEWHITARYELGEDAPRPATFRVVWFVTIAPDVAVPPLLGTEAGLTATFADGAAYRFDDEREWHRSGE